MIHKRNASIDSCNKASPIALQPSQPVPMAPLAGWREAERVGVGDEELEMVREGGAVAKCCGMSRAPGRLDKSVRLMLESTIREGRKLCRRRNRKRARDTAGPVGGGGLALLLLLLLFPMSALRLQSEHAANMHAAQQPMRTHLLRERGNRGGLLARALEWRIIRLALVLPRERN